MGGFSLSDMQSWDKQGRKKGITENLVSVLDGMMTGVDANRKRGQEDLLMEAKMRESGYSKEPSASGMSGLVNALAGRNNQYSYTGKPLSAFEQARVNDYEAKRTGAGYYDRSKSEKSTPDQVMKIYDSVTKEAQRMFGEFDSPEKQAYIKERTAQAMQLYGLDPNMFGQSLPELQEPTLPPDGGSVGRLGIASVGGLGIADVLKKLLGGFSSGSKASTSNDKYFDGI